MNKSIPGRNKLNLIDFGIKLQYFAERFLTWRKKKKLKKMEKLQKKHPVLDWLEAIFVALLMVLLIQQFLFELCVVPTGSMIPAIEINSRVAMEKITFGPEIIPGYNRLPPVRALKRGEIIMFENPDLEPLNPVMNILHKILYRITITLVNIDTDKYGSPRQRLLLKRAIAIPGDRIRLVNGNVEILPGGSGNWKTEEDLKRELGIVYTIRRNMNPDMPVDGYSRQLSSLENNYKKTPHNRVLGDNMRQKKWGWYITDNSFFPMGDNRDNSRDARYYGPVSTNRIMGKALFRVWPLNKFGRIK